MLLVQLGINSRPTSDVWKFYQIELAGPGGSYNFGKNFQTSLVLLIPICTRHRMITYTNLFLPSLSCREFFVALGGAEGLLLVQCDNGEANFNLIACCRYLVDETRRRTLEDIDDHVKPIHIIFIIQLPKIAGGCQHFVGFQGGKWQSVHIDELLESNEQLPQIEQLVNRSVSDLFQPADPARGDVIEDMDVDLDASILSGSQELHVENREVKERKMSYLVQNNGPNGLI